MVIILGSMVINMMDNEKMADTAEQKMVNTKYGVFTESQVVHYIKDIQKMIFWCLLYADPKTSVEYPEVNIPSYQKGIMKKIVGFNSLMGYPKEILGVVSTLEAALILLESDDYSFSEYRKLILDAGSLAGKMKVGGT